MRTLRGFAGMEWVGMRHGQCSETRLALPYTRIPGAFNQCRGYDGEIGRHHAAYRRRKSAVQESRVGQSRDNVLDSRNKAGKAEVCQA